MYLVTAVVLAGLAVGCGSKAPTENVPPSTSLPVSSQSTPDRTEESVRKLSEKGIVPLNPAWNKQLGVLTFGMAETVCTGEYHPGTPFVILPTLTVRREESVVGRLLGDDITFGKLRTDPPLEICWQF